MGQGLFLRELKRRRVLRTALYYVIGCWFTLEFFDIAGGAIGLDQDAAARIFLLIAILGFPVNLALAWYFQITPRGIVRTTSFVERRVLCNVPPIDDRRDNSRSSFFKKEEQDDASWIIAAETGPLAGMSFAITQPIVIGRSLDCDLAVVTPHISRRHAKLELDDHQLYLEDLGSSNGTVVNGKTIQSRTSLRHEDEIRLHDIVFRITESYSGLRQNRETQQQTTTFHQPASAASPEDAPP